MALSLELPGITHYLPPHETRSALKVVVRPGGEELGIQPGDEIEVCPDSTFRAGEQITLGEGHLVLGVGDRTAVTVREPARARRAEPQ